MLGDDLSHYNLAVKIFSGWDRMDEKWKNNSQLRLILFASLDENHQNHPFNIFYSIFFHDTKTSYSKTFSWQMAAVVGQGLTMLTQYINVVPLGFLCACFRNTNKSGVTGQGMKEAQNINKSLSALGDVIQSLVVTLLQFLPRIFRVGARRRGGGCAFCIVFSEDAMSHCEERKLERRQL